MEIQLYNVHIYVRNERDEKITDKFTLVLKSSLSYLMSNALYLKLSDMKKKIYFLQLFLSLSQGEGVISHLCMQTYIAVIISRKKGILLIRSTTLCEQILNKTGYMVSFKTSLITYIK